MLILDMSPPSFGQNERVMEKVRGAGACGSWNAGLSSRIAFANSRTFPRSTGNVTVPRSVPMIDLSAIATSVEDERCPGSSAGGQGGQQPRERSEWIRLLRSPGSKRSAEGGPLRNRKSNQEHAMPIE